MTADERDNLIEVANIIDEADRECTYMAMATPTLEKCRHRAMSAKVHLLKAEQILAAMGIPLVRNPEGMI